MENNDAEETKPTGSGNELVVRVSAARLQPSPGCPQAGEAAFDDQPMVAEPGAVAIRPWSRPPRARRD